MEEFELFTYGVDGDFVVSVTIPAFTPHAEAILWGSRFFLWNKDRNRYEEGSVFAVPEFMVKPDAPKSV
jgi:hypothetical protein